jgi:hypothetical protein
MSPEIMLRIALAITVLPFSIWVLVVLWHSGEKFMKPMVVTYSLAILGVALLLASEAKAGPTYSLVVHGTSKHGRTDDAYKFNEANLGLGLRANFTKALALQAGGYRNSYYRQTNYLALSYLPLEVGSVRVGGFVAAVSGYEGRRLGGGALLSVALLDRVQLEVTLIPKTRAQETYCVATQLVIGF